MCPSFLASPPTRVVGSTSFSPLHQLALASVIQKQVEPPARTDSSMSSLSLWCHFPEESRARGPAVPLEASPIDQVSDPQGPVLEISTETEREAVVETVTPESCGIPLASPDPSLATVEAGTEISDVAVAEEVPLVQEHARAPDPADVSGDGILATQPTDGSVKSVETPLGEREVVSRDDTPDATEESIFSSCTVS